MTILIAEDNDILAKNIVKCLQRSGYETIAVGTAAAAREILAQTPVSALCLDVQLPDGNGLSIIEGRRGARARDVPVVIITGSGTAEERRRAEACGVTAFFMKPFALSDLTAVLDEALRKRDRQ